ncbi:ABC transporter permease subunit [Rhodococcus aerolatus]
MPRASHVLVVLLLGVLGVLALGGTALASAAAPAPAAAPLAAQATGGVQVSGTLTNGGDRLSGVTVKALDATGAEVATTTSGSDGRFQLTVPAGTYTFQVDPATLPAGVSVQGDVTRQVSQGQLAVVLFSFGQPREALQTSLVDDIVNRSVDGLRFGLVIAITAVGLSLIYGTTGLTNFAHGELVTLGAVIAWVVNVKLGVQLIPATAIAIVVGVGVGMLNDLAIWRPLRRRRSGLVAQLVVSIGLSIALRYLILVFFSDRSQPFADYQGQVQKTYGPVQLTDVNLACIVISFLVLVGVALLLQRTRIGKAMRAVADNRDLAASSGIDVDRVVLFVWGLGGGLATLGGVLFGMSELAGTVQYEMGFKLLLLMFAGITLGGLGTAYGALLGCVIVGLLVQLSTLVINPDLKYTGGLLVLIVILILRPQGILGSRSRIG